MPYASDKQRRFMHARHPGIAREWDAEIRGKRKRGSLKEIRKSFIWNSGTKSLVDVPITNAGKAVPGRARRVRAQIEYSQRVRRPAPKASRNSRAEYEQIKSRVKAERRAQTWRDRMNPPKVGTIPAGQPMSLGGTTKAPYKVRPPVPSVSRSDEIANRYQATQNSKAKVKQRRRQQKEAEARREAGVRADLDVAYHNVHVTGRQKRALAIAAGGTTVAGGGLYAVQRPREDVTKDDRDRDAALGANVRQGGSIARDAALGAGVGGGTAYLADTLGGFATKKTLARRRRNALANDPKYRKKYEKHWNKFKTERKFDEAIHSGSSNRIAGVMRHYPKALKDWRGQRALALESHPAAQAALFGGAALGGAALAVRRGQQRRQVGKAYAPQYFAAPAPTERSQARKQRTRAELQHQGASVGGNLAAAGATGALGLRLLGHARAPEFAAKLAPAEKIIANPKGLTATAARTGIKAHQFAAPKRGRLLAVAGGLAASSAGLKAVARWKRDEAQGISSDIGRANAGERAYRHSERKVGKSLTTALGIEMGAKGYRSVKGMTPKQRARLVRVGVPAAAAVTGGTGTVVLTRRAQKRRAELAELREHGGLTGPVMKSEEVAVGKANRGTNLTQYPYLPENVRTDVGYGSIHPRRNPMSPLELFASSRVMTQAAARAQGMQLRGRRLTGRAKNEMYYAGGRAMIYSPVGRGSVF